MERQQLEETLAALQAQNAALQMVVKTLLRQHPDPLALLETWREIRADAEHLSPLVPSDVRHSRWVAEQMQCFAEDWTAELADLVTTATAIDVPMNRPAPDHQPEGKPAPARRKPISGAPPDADPPTA